MKELNELCDWLEDEGVFLFERNISFGNKDSNAATIQLKSHHDIWGIFLDKHKLDTEAKTKSALLHECGHYVTGATHEISSPFDLIEKHEHKADKWAVEQALSAEELDDAIANGYTEIWDLAEYFGITEDLMRKAVCWYTYGNLTTELYF